MKKKWVVSESDSGVRVQNLLVEKLEGTISGKQIKRAIEANALLVNGTIERFASRRVSIGDVIEFTPILHQPSKSVSFELERILYEDDYFLIYNKPTGIVSDLEGLTAVLKQYHSEIQPVHRLDKGTTGALIFSKDDGTKKRFIELFRKKKVKKKYFALVDGVVEHEVGLLQEPLGVIHHRSGQTKRGVLSIKEGGKEAKTRWKKIKTGTTATLLSCQPVTGRTHQLRIHLSEFGHPILGDTLYGTSFVSDYRPPHLLLHASALQFPHPFKKEMIAVSAPLPVEFDQALVALIGVIE